MKSISLANTKVRRLYMSEVKSSRDVKLTQIRLQLSNILIKRKEDNIKIEQKTASKLSRIIGCHWWLSLNDTALIHQIPKIKREYFKPKNNISKIRETYLKEISKEEAQPGKSPIGKKTPLYPHN